MKKKDIYNLISLVCVQASNALMPLVVFPLALISLGVENYSRLAMAEALTVIVNVIVLYSFEIDGPSKVIKIISIGERGDIAKIFSSIFYVRVILFLLVIIFLLPSAWLFVDSDFAILLALWMAIPLSIALQPNWLFQALEKNQFFAFVFVVSRVISMVLIFSYVSNAEDILLVPIFIGVCHLFCALFTLLYVNFFLGFKLRRVPLEMLLFGIKNGYQIFFGNLAVTLYRDLNILVLGMVGAGATVMSAYSLAEKIIKGLQVTMRPLNQFFFPKALKRLTQNLDDGSQGVEKLWPLLYPQLLALFVLVLILVSSWYYAVHNSVKINYWSNSELVLILSLIMLPATFFGIANFMFGVAGLNFMGYQKYMLNILLLTGILSIFVVCILSSYFGAVGAAVTFSFSEVLLFSLIILKYISLRSVRA